MIKIKIAFIYLILVLLLAGFACYSREGYHVIDNIEHYEEINVVLSLTEDENSYLTSTNDVSINVFGLANKPFDNHDLLYLSNYASSIELNDPYNNNDNNENSGEIFLIIFGVILIGASLPFLIRPSFISRFAIWKNRIIPEHREPYEGPSDLSIILAYISLLFLVGVGIFSIIIGVDLLM